MAFQFSFIAAAVLNNSGHVGLVRFLNTIDTVKEYYPFWNSIHGSKGLEDVFHRALSLKPGYFPIRRGLVQWALATGDATGAVETLASISAADICRRPPFGLQAVTAYSYSDDPMKVLWLTDRCDFPDWAVLIPDHVLLALLQRATLDDLSKAYSLRPGDLYAGFRIWQEELSRGNQVLADSYADRLAEFPISAIRPLDRRLLAFEAEAILDLLENGSWDRETTARVVSFLVWQYADAVEVEEFIQDLSARFPSDFEWPFYLAELYQRRHNWSGADLLYHRALQLNPESTRAKLRLAMVKEAQCRVGSHSWPRCMTEVLGLYTEYNSIAPEDLFGLKKIIELTAFLEPAEATSWWGKSTSLQMAGGLVWDQGELALQSKHGANLIANSGFESWSGQIPTSWIVADYAQGPQRGEGQCFVGPDNLEGVSANAARIVCFWFEEQSNVEPGRYGLWLWFQDAENRHETEARLHPGHAFEISAHFRTCSLPDGAAKMAIPGIPASDITLESTNCGWRYVSVSAENAAESSTLVRPLLTLWAPGEAWFDNVQVRETELAIFSGKGD